jgi:hypothetical protein
LICTAVEENKQERLWLCWLVSGECREMEFDEFYKRSDPKYKTNDDKSAEDILDEIGEKMAALGL